MISTINAEIKQAMLNKDTDAKNVLKSVKNRAILMAKTAKTEVNDAFIFQAAKKEMKQLKETLSLIPDTSDLYKTTKRQIAVIEKYVPAQLSDDELRNRIKTIIDTLPENANFGVKMKACVAELKDVADGNKISRIVKEI